MSDWEEIKKRLEPVALKFYTTPYNDIQLSIAISLKRIADALEGESVKQPVIMTVDIRTIIRLTYYCQPYN